LSVEERVAIAEEKIKAARVQREIDDKKNAIENERNRRINDKAMI
jgi:hypothetical protein